MVNYSNGVIEDFEDIIDFGNYVFGIDFKKLLPKLYGEKVDTSTNHFIVKDNNKIKGMVGCFPLELNVINTILKVKGIGTVSVHPYSRNKGYMIQLMNNAINEMNKDSIDFAVLGGQRQRYEYFGFTPTGSQITFEVTEENIKHKKSNFEADILLKALDDLSEDDLKSIYILHNGQSVHGTRDFNSFTYICKSWNSNPFGVYSKNKLIGYIILSKNYDSVKEIYLTDYGILIELLSNIMKRFHKEKVDVIAAVHRQQLITNLEGICESYKIEPNTCLNIFNYKNFIKAFLQLKSSYEILEKGQLIIEIIDRESIIISVDENITVEIADGIADVKLSHLQAMNFLCSSIRPFVNEARAVNNLIKSWFPLPFFFPEIDNV